MADTKQATAEMVLCECGHDFVYHSYVPNCIHAGCICTRYTPRTQPSQAELRIPDDLKALHEHCMSNPHQYDFANGGTVKELIERLARLEGAGR